MAVTYETPELLRRTVYIPVSDFAEGKEAEFRKQHEARRGSLFEAFENEERKAIKKDLEQIKPIKPRKLAL